MKKTILFICLVIGTFQAFAQQETLFNKARVMGAFGAPIVEIGIGGGNQFGNAYGGGAGLIIDNFFIGAYGLGSTDIEGLINEDNPVLDIAHGGLWLGYSYRSYKLLHPYANVRLGYGAAHIDLEQDFDHRLEIDQITAVTPEIGVELNVTKFFHITAGVGYRWINGVSDSTPYTNNDFSGMNAALSFRFGWFGSWKNRGE